MAHYAVIFAVRASDWLTYQDTRWGNTMQQSKVEKMAGRADYLLNTRTLLNADIKNNTGETLGKVKELILNDNRDCVLYVVIESNGTVHPVPWAAFGLAPAGIVLDVEKIRFMNSPQTGSNYLEKLESADLRKEIRSFYSERIDAAMKAAHPEKAVAPAMEKPVFRTCSSVIGLKVENIQGENLASVRSLIIDTRHGTIPYALVGFGGLFGIAEKTAAVPLKSLAIQPAEKVAYLDADKATLKTAVVDEANLEKLTEPRFTRSIAETFGDKPYWEVLGFVPGEPVSLMPGITLPHTTDLDPKI
jgi:sporulation protein YlmC with PRC-barrel domain